MLPLILISLSLSAFAEGEGCAALIEELKIPTPVNGVATMRKFSLKGKTEDDKKCRVDFVPDFCTFQLGAPLEAPLMYYLMATDVSSVKIKFTPGEKFSFKAVTREDKDDLGKLTKTLEISRAKKGGYKFEFKIQDGVIFKQKVLEYRCEVSLAPAEK